jgi:hypothetical protein
VAAREPSLVALMLQVAAAFAGGGLLLLRAKRGSEGNDAAAEGREQRRPSRRQPTVHRQPVVSWASRVGARWLPLSDKTSDGAQA